MSIMRERLGASAMGWLDADSRRSRIAARRFRLARVRTAVMPFQRVSVTVLIDQAFAGAARPLQARARRLSPLLIDRCRCRESAHQGRITRRIIHRRTGDSAVPSTQYRPLLPPPERDDAGLGYFSPFIHGGGSARCQNAGLITAAFPCTRDRRSSRTLGRADDDDAARSPSSS